MYDFEGNLSRVKNGVDPTVFIGGIYEVHTATGDVTKHYFADGMRVAVRNSGTLSYLAEDHLGRASAAFNANGGLLGTQRYLPYGETWYSNPPGGTLPTDRTFTGYLEVGPTFALYEAGRPLR